MEGRREDCYRKGKEGREARAEGLGGKEEGQERVDLGAIQKLPVPPREAKNELALALSENFRYLQEVFPATLYQARKYAIAVYENSFEFEAPLLTKYKEGMKDIKASFTLANPSLIGLNWSFMPKISRETQVGNGHGAVVWVAEQSVVVVEELETTTKPRVTEQADTRANPPSEL